MQDERTRIAVEAAAKALLENAPSRQFTWEESSEEWRVDLRNAVRPMVEAALAASDAFIALAIAKRNESIRSQDTP